MVERGNRNWEVLGVFASIERAIMAFNDEKKLFPIIKGKYVKVDLGRVYSVEPPQELKM